MDELKVFISYSHSDEEICKKFLNHLSALKRRRIIKEWYDRELIAGQDFDKNIRQELIDADIIIFLVSSDFIASDYCNDVEVKKALEQHSEGTSIVVPVIIRPCDWKDLPFSKLQGLPKNANPIVNWTNIDDGFLDTVEGIKKLAESIKKTTPTTINIKDDNSNFQSFQNDVVLSLLPRGYILIEQIEYQKHSTWSVVATYFNYQGDCIHGTHYHESYRSSWETLSGHYEQCLKLKIPRADADYADSAIEIIMRLRERTESDNIEELTNLYTANGDLSKYYPANSRIPKPTVPEIYSKLSKTGDLRDVIDELNISPWKNYELKTLHSNMESIRRQSQLVAFELLPDNHPAYSFVKQIAESYKDDFNLENLKSWAERLSSSLYDAIKYIKE